MPSVQFHARRARRSRSTLYSQDLHTQGYLLPTRPDGLFPNVLRQREDTLSKIAASEQKNSSALSAVVVRVQLGHCMVSRQPESVYISFRSSAGRSRNVVFGPLLMASRATMPSSVPCSGSSQEVASCVSRDATSVLAEFSVTATPSWKFRLWPA